MDENEKASLIQRIKKLEDMSRAISSEISQLGDKIRESETDLMDLNIPAEVESPPPVETPASWTPDPPPKAKPVTPPPSKSRRFNKLSPDFVVDDSAGSAPEKPLEKPKKEKSKSEIDRGEYWLNKIGISLLLLGVVFLFKYSWDQKWITPWMRLMFGIGLGGGLLYLGKLIYTKQPHLSRVLMGGGIATFYITGYSAFQIYHLVPQSAALIFMTGVTALTYYLSIKQSEPILSIIAVVGGLGTPFLLHTGSGNIPGLVGYSSLIVAGSLSIFYFRKWYSLLWTTWAGGYLVMGIATFNHSGHKVAAQIGILFMWLAFWVISLIPYLKKENLRNKIDSPNTSPKETIFKSLEMNERFHYFLTVLLALGPALLLTMELWSFSDFQWGLVYWGLALIYILATALLNYRRTDLKIVYLHGIVSVLLVIVAQWYFFDDEAFFLALTLDATGLYYANHRLKEPTFDLIGHVLYAISALWVMGQLLFGEVEGTGVVNSKGFIELIIILLAFPSIYFKLPEEDKHIGLFAVYLFLLAWVFREVGSFQNGNGYVSITWGIIGTALLSVGLWKNNSDMFKVGYGTLILVAAKLLFFDLSHLETIWRIVLFIGFGGAFLGISYLIKEFWKPETQPETGS